MRLYGILIFLLAMVLGGARAAEFYVSPNGRTTIRGPAQSRSALWNARASCNSTFERLESLHHCPQHLRPQVADGQLARGSGDNEDRKQSDRCRPTLCAGTLKSIMRRRFCAPTQVSCLENGFPGDPHSRGRAQVKLLSRWFEFVRQRIRQNLYASRKLEGEWSARI
jgi:hypothetical protein